MKNNIKILILVIVVLWIFLIFYLSSQDGTQTANLSSTISEYISKVIYKEPTGSELQKVHVYLRRMAHVLLFFVLGILLMCVPKVKGTQFYKVIIPNMLLVSGISFLDEWRKQFIDGRHFDTFDVKLNIISGIVGIFITFIVIKIKLRKIN